MLSTHLFVYGTLRHDQPEHARYCRGVLAWRPATVRGRLLRLASGYDLVLVPETTVLLAATRDAAGDERRRRALEPAYVARAADPAGPETWDWIGGEVLTLEDAAGAWPALDAWEDFTPGRSLAYQRCVVPVAFTDGEAPHPLAAWAYVATQPPVGAQPV